MAGNRMGALRLYGRYALVSIRMQMEYRAAFVMQAIGAFLVNIIEFAGIWALFHRFGTLRGWRLEEVALLYGMAGVAWSLTELVSTGFDHFGVLIRRGDFDRVLLRPRAVVLQLLGHEFTLRRLGRLLQALLVLGWALGALHALTQPLTWLLLPLALTGAVCLFLGLLILQATLSFWTVETLEVFNCLTYGGVYASQYPLPIYRDWFRRLFLYVVPLGAVIYLPAVAIMGRTDPMGSTLWQQCAAPACGPVFLLAAMCCWRLGVRRYTSTGS